MFGLRRRSQSLADATARADGLSVLASLRDGPMKGHRIHTRFVQGRAPGTIDVPGNGCDHRYGLTQWTQGGSSARYSFLYDVRPDAGGG